MDLNFSLISGKAKIKELPRKIRKELFNAT